MKLMTGLLLLTIFATTPLADETRTEVRPHIVEYVDSLLNNIRTSRRFSVDLEKLGIIRAAFHEGISHATLMLTEEQSIFLLDNIRKFGSHRLGLMTPPHGGNDQAPPSSMLLPGAPEDQLLEFTYSGLHELNTMLISISHREELTPTGERRLEIEEQISTIIEHGSQMIDEEISQYSNQDIEGAWEIHRAGIKQLIDSLIDPGFKRELNKDELQSLYMQWEKMISDQVPNRSHSSRSSVDVIHLIRQMEMVWRYTYQSDIEEARNFLTDKLIEHGL